MSTFTLVNVERLMPQTGRVARAAAIKLAASHFGITVTPVSGVRGATAGTGGSGVEVGGCGVHGAGSGVWSMHAMLNEYPSDDSVLRPVLRAAAGGNMTTLYSLCSKR